MKIQFLLYTISAIFFSIICNARSSDYHYKCIYINKGKSSTIKTKINSVVSETEEGFVETECGIYYLPSDITEVEMKKNDFNILLEGLINCTNKETTLFLSGKTLLEKGTAIVGFSCGGSNDFITKYSYKKIEEIHTGFSTKSGKMRMWYEDSYRISVQMDTGVYCVMREYKNLYYYKKVLGALVKISKPEEEVNKFISISFFPSDGNEECAGGFLRSVELNK